MSWVLIFDSTGCRVLVEDWLDLECFLVCDYLWRQEKHINRESYILLIGEYLVSMAVNVGLYPLVLVGMVSTWW